MPLLDRLKAGSSLPLEKDIALHLERLLNLRKGSLALDRKLGLEAQSQLHLAADEQRFQGLMTLIVEQIRCYEPRLQPKSLDFTQLGGFNAQGAPGRKPTVSRVSAGFWPG